MWKLCQIYPKIYSNGRYQCATFSINMGLSPVKKILQHWCLEASLIYEFSLIITTRYMNFSANTVFKDFYEVCVFAKTAKVQTHETPAITLKTLPKAQRTRGLSSSFQSNFHLQNLDQESTSKSQDSYDDMTIDLK